MNGVSAIWIWIAIIGACIGGYMLYRQGKLPWMRGRVRGIKLPSVLGAKTGTKVEQLKEQTKVEVAKAEELRKVLEAKRELAKATSVRVGVQKEINDVVVNDKSIGKEKEKQEEQKAQDALKMKPRRL